MQSGYPPVFTYGWPGLFFYMRIQEAGTQYLHYLQYEKLARPATIKGRTKEINRLTARWLNMKVKKISLKHIDDLKLEMQKKGNSIHYVRRIVMTVKLLFVFLHDEKRLKVIDPRMIKNLKEPRKDVSYLDPEEVTALLDFEINNIFSVRLMAWIMLILSTGMRITESLQIQRNQIHKRAVEIEGKMVDLYFAKIEGKGGIPRQVIIQPWAMAWIDTYLSMRTDDHPALFVNHSHHTQGKQYGFWREEDLRYFLRQADKRVGRRVTPHEIRRTASTLTNMNGADVKSIQEMLGHKSLQYTNRYLGVDYIHLSKVLYKHVWYEAVTAPPDIQKQWALFLGTPACKGCGETTKPHRTKGYCSNCYVNKSVDKNTARAYNTTI